MPHASSANPAPLTPEQLHALGGAAARELSWGLREVAVELGQWRRHAEFIPDAPIREDALRGITRKRAHADGAALFSILPDRRNRDLIRLLVCYETILDFLDDVSERHATEINGRELHMALVDAFDPDRPLSDYYRHHPWRDDGGYLVALVEACRRSCRSLPSFERVRRHVVQEAWRAQVLALNHLTDPSARDAALAAWAADEFPEEGGLAWFELSAAASATLVILALLTLAACDEVSDGDIASTYSAYWPWVSLAAAMLDSHVDRAEDDEAGDHSYVSHYPDEWSAVRRIRYCIGRAVREAIALPNGHRHAVIVGSMVAMYLSKDSAQTTRTRRSTKQMVRAGGSLCRLLHPILRLWRIAYSQRSA
jgi:tetraprenyl-beta-curcumene synthase